jgi:iron complex transport system substrate-binding protein
MRCVLVILFAMGLAACGKPTAPVAATGPAPAGVVASQPASKPPRIVSTVPAATLNLVLIGAADHLVGVTKYDRVFLPAERRNLPVVGDYETMNYEELVKLKPDTLIIQFAESRIKPQLKELAAAQHIELLNMHFDSTADIWTSVAALGKAAGMEPQANLAIAAAQGDLRDIAAQYKDKPHPKVAYIVDTTQFALAGGKTFIDEMITAAGGENVGGKAGDMYPNVSRETLVKLAPEVLLIAAPDEPEQAANDPRLAQWQSLPIPAAARKRIFLVTDGNSVMPNIDIARNVRALAGLIHGDDAAGTGGMP